MGINDRLGAHLKGIDGVLGKMGAFLCNWDATDDPNQYDDSSLGYAVGSRWYNASSQQLWICLSAELSNAEWGKCALLEINDLTDVDTDTDPPELNQVLKWKGAAYGWVPGTAGDTTEFSFSIDGFSTGVSMATSLIGSGTWKAIGAMSFTASYSNPPTGMTAQVAMSGSQTPWVGNLNMTPVEGPEANTNRVDYPSSATGTITFTLSQSADGTTAQSSISFSNTMRRGNSVLGQGAQTEASLESLGEVSGPNESRTQTINNVPATAQHLVFAYADRLSDIQQVQIDVGYGFITAAFNTDSTVVAPTVQSGITNVNNSLGFSETFACVTSKIVGLANGTRDFKLVGDTTAVNYIFYGGSTTSTGWSEAQVEGLDEKEATNDDTQTWDSVTLEASEYFLWCAPTRLGTPLFYDNTTGFELAMESPEVVAVTNPGGFQEDYNVFRSTNILGPGTIVCRTE